MSRKALKGMQGYIDVYKGLCEYTKVYKGIQSLQRYIGSIGVYKGIQVLTRVWVYRGLQR